MIPRCTRRRARTVGALALALTLAVAAPAGADVLVVPDAPEDAPRGSFPVRLHLPDGSARALAAVSGAGGYGQAPLVPSPDRRLAAGVSENGRVRLLSLDGEPTRTLGVGGLGTVEPGLAWSADGARITVWGLDAGADRDVTQTCVVATGACTTADASRSTPIGALADGRLLRLSLDAPFPRELQSSRWQQWRRTSSREVARLRRQLRRPPTARLTLDRADGGPATELRRVEMTLGRWFELPTSDVGRSPAATLLSTYRLRYRLLTRRRGGRLQAQFDVGFGRTGLLQVSADGSQRTVPTRELAAEVGSDDSSDFGAVLLTPFAAAADGSWIASAGGRPGMPLSRVALDGRTTPLTVGGRPATARVLLQAAGVAARDLPSAKAPTLLSDLVYEPATDSAILVVGDRRRRAHVLRVPLSGDRPPSRIERLAAHQSVAIAAW